jgi:peptidoglycan hydrolase-like protein with peptidoglycan-binding domain
MINKCWLATTGVVLLAAAAALAAEGRYGGHTLEYGMLDSDFAADYVSLLQSDLSKLGYDDYLLASGKLEKIFGPATTAAVKAFQSDWGLSPTGVVAEETTAALERALAGETPQRGGPGPQLTLLESGQITIVAGKKGEYKFKPQPGTVYVLTGEGDCLECDVITPYDVYAGVDPVPLDVREALKALGDEGKAVIFDDIPFAGEYIIEVEPLNDLSDIPVLIRIYELTR